MFLRDKSEVDVWLISIYGTVFPPPLARGSPITKIVSFFIHLTCLRAALTQHVSIKTPIELNITDGLISNAMIQ